MSIARSTAAGGPTPLVIADDGTTYQLAEDGLGRPARSWRVSKAPDSPDIHGSEAIGAALEESELPVRLIVKAASTSALNTALDALELALSQFAYDVTVTIDGQARVWSCGPADSQASLDSGQASAHLSNVSVAFPVYPIAGGP